MNSFGVVSDRVNLVLGGLSYSPFSLLIPSGESIVFLFASSSITWDIDTQLHVDIPPSKNYNVVLPVASQDYSRTNTARRPTKNDKKSKTNAHLKSLYVV